MNQSAGSEAEDRAFFVGRERELAEAQAGWGACVAGRGGLLLVTGEPGIGKTRFSEEIIRFVQQRGGRTLCGACNEDRAAPAYWPWVPILRGLGGEHDSVAPGGADPIARFLQDLLASNTPPIAVAGALAEENRFLFFDSVSQALHANAARSPLLIILDDLHAADVASLSLLNAIAPTLRSGRALIVGTFREADIERRPDAIRLLNTAARHGRRLQLGGLSAVETRRLIEIIHSLPVSSEVADEVHQRTEGNPLFVDEIARWMALGAATRRIGTAIPPGVRAVIRERLMPLSPQSRKLLDAAAVIGRDFDLATLHRVTGQGPGEILTLLAEARAAELSAPVPETVGRERFGHVLTRDVIYDDLDPSERARLHVDVGVAIEQAQAGLIEAHLAELAYHFGRAVPAGAATKAVDYAVRAGERAAQQLAYEDAATYFEKALDALALCPADHFRRCEIELALAGVRSSAGEARTRASFQRVAALARSLVAADRKRAARLLAEAAIGMAERGIGLPQPLPDPEVRQLLGDALERLGGDDKRLTARLLALLSMERALDGGDDQCVALGARAIELAEGVGDPVVLSLALSAHHFVLWRRHRLDDCLKIASRIVDLAERSGDRRLDIHGRGWRMVDWMTLGDTNLFAQEIDKLARAAAPLKQPRYEWIVANYRAMYALWKGAWVEAEELATQALTLGERTADVNAMNSSLLQTFLSRRERGVVADDEMRIRFFIERYPDSPSPRTLLALMLLDSGNLDGAQAEFERLAAQSFADLRREHRIGVLPWLAEICAAVGDRPRAELLYAQVEPYVHFNMPIGPAGFAGSGFYYLGLLAETLGQAPLALRHFDTATRENDRMQGESWAAWSRLAAARIRIDGGAEVGFYGVDEAETLLHAARNSANRLSMVRLQRAVDAIYRKLTATAVVRPPAASGGGKVVPLHRGAGSTASVMERRSQTKSAPPDAMTVMVFRLDGQFWTVGRPTRLLRLKHTKGFEYLKRLLQQPDQAIHVLDLAGAPGAVDGAEASTRAEGLAVGSWKQFDPIGVDAQARNAYRRRLEDLRDQLAEAEHNNDTGRLESLRTEIEFLVRELADAGSRTRPAGHAERARLNVTRAIKAVIQRIADDDAEIGRYLQTTIHTGMLCRYAPDLRFPMRWALD